CSPWRPRARPSPPGAHPAWTCASMRRRPAARGASTLQRAYAPPAWRYSTPAIVLHWLLAALIVFMAALGWSLMEVEHERGGERWFDLHKSIGLIVLLLVALRVL